MIMRILLALGIVAAAVTGWLVVGQASGSAATATPVATSAPIDPTDMPYRGMAIQVASGWYKPAETYVPLFREIADLGANTVLLSVAGHMEHAGSQAIYIDVRKAPPPTDLKMLVRKANEYGLKTILMPIVLLKHPRGSEWRGVIDPPDWDEWWQQYEAFVLHFADIANASQAAALMVGSELVSTEKFTGKWEKLIAKVRERYGGKLGYSANWDHYEPVKFWDKLDFIGMTSYYTLADHDQPKVEEIVARWKPIKAEILRWQRTIGKPILMTEVGWCSQEGAAKAPWNYFQNQKATPGGMEEQRRLYEAFIRVWGDTPELIGVIWWEWKADAGGPQDYGYTPKGKPAERVLKRWFGGNAKSDKDRE